jgi:hypothetical protein
VDLYGYAACYLILREERRLRGTGKMVLRNI